MNIRLLLEDEFDEFIAALDKLGLAAAVPAPEICQIIVAEENGKFVGFRIIQCVIHASSLWIDPAYRGKGLGTALIKMAETVLDETLGDSTPHYVFTDGKMESVIADLGYQQLPWKVWTRGRTIKPKEEVA